MRLGISETLDSISEVKVPLYSIRNPRPAKSSRRIVCRSAACMQKAVDRGIFRQRRPSTAFPNMIAILGTARRLHL